MYIGNVMLLGLNLPLIGIWVRLLKVRYPYLAVTVAIICIIGAYSVRNNIFDVGIMVVFGIVGYFMRKGGFPGAPLLLAMVLGRMLERSVQQALTMSGGDLAIFIQRPISAGLLVVAAIVLLSPLVRFLWRRQKTHGRERR
jgi:putative tricarboxylic transport membrane protein